MYEDYYNDELIDFDDPEIDDALGFTYD